MPKKSWGFAVGNVRARENSLFNKQDIEQMLGLKEISELMAFLADKGYCGDTIDEMCENATAAVWQYGMETASAKEELFPFICKNDFYNLKLVLKGILSGKAYEHLIMIPNTVDVAVMRTAISDKRFDLLPDYMRAAAEKAYNVLAHTSDAQLSDGIIDVCGIEKSMSAAEEVKVSLIENYIKAESIYSIFKVALRAAKTNKTADFLEQTLCGFKEVSKSELKKAVLSGEDAVLELLAKFRKIGGDDAAEAFKKSPSGFEKFVDDRLMSIAREGKRTTLGAEVLIGYVLAVLGEIKTINLLASGIRTGQDETKIRERLRELYG